MNNNSWGKRSYQNVASKDLDSGEDPGGGGSNLANQARMEGVNLQKEAAKKKFFFHQKMTLEGKRKSLGKGNIVTFLLSNAKHGIEMNEVNKILRIGGFTPDQVLALKINDFRTNQVEVLFKGDVSIDTMKVEEKLRKGDLDIIMSKFDHAEEFLIIYGLPPSANLDALKEKITDSVTPFVKKVLDVAPCMYRGEVQGDFFAGKYDGNWRLKVIPRKSAYIPNYIVIGNEVMGRAVYTKRLGDKEEMCSECYRPGHYRKDCSGSRKWSDYCKEFRENWEHLLANKDEDEIEDQEDEESESIMSRLRKSEKRKSEYANEKVELERQVEKQNKDIDGLRKYKEHYEKRLEKLEVEKSDMEKQVLDLQSSLMRQKNIIRDGCDVESDYRIQVLESENVEKDEEIAELKKISEVTHSTMEENNFLKEQVKKLQEEKSAILAKVVDFEDQFKVTHRRLSKSNSCENEMRLDDTASQEMFAERSNDSPPFHGFASPLDQNDGKNDGATLKRARSSPGSMDVKKMKNRHPRLGSRIVVDATDSKGIYLVKSKKSSSDNDFIYVLEKDNKDHTLNLKRVDWVIYDAFDRVPLKPKETV